MERFKRVRTLLRAFTTLIVVNFAFNLHHLMIAYVNSSFLGQFFSTEAVSILYIFNSIIVLSVLLIIPSLIGILGTRWLLVLLIPLLQLSVLLLGFSGDPVSAGFFFIAQGVIIAILFYILDLYVEGSTKEEGETGEIRATFLTAGSLAGFFAPIFIAFLVIQNNYPPLYAFATILLTPAFALSLTAFSRLPSITPKRNAIREAIHTIRCCKPGVSYVLGAHFLLRMFYSWVVVYAPLYLIAEAGISWQAVGTMTALAVFAYVLLQIPLGILSDRYFGEKEIMVIGFIIMALSFASLSIIPVSLLFVWGLAFVFTRVGAAMVEIATEAHFFKKVNVNDSALISIFRILGPLGFIVGPLIALLILPITGLQYIFGFFGVILLTGVLFALKIVDTK